MTAGPWDLDTSTTEGIMKSHEITSRLRPAVLLAVPLSLVLAAGCGQDEDPSTSDHSAEPGQDAVGDEHDHAGMEHDDAGEEGHDHVGMDHGDAAGMEMDGEAMERHAEEAHEAAERLREHARDFADLAPAEQHERMAEHVGLLAEVFRMVDRQTAEMSGGMPMDHDAMGEMMEMSGEEHRRMREEFDDVRSEAETLQTASVQDVEIRMSDHLESLEGMADELDAMAMGHHAHPDHDHGSTEEGGGGV